MSKVYKGHLNQVQLIGGLKEIPEIHQSEFGSITTATLVTKRSAKNKSGKFEELTEWHRVVVTGNRAEFLEKYSKPGMRFYVEGYLRHRKLEMPDTHENKTAEQDKYYYVTEIVAETFEPMDVIKSRDEPKDSPGSSDPEF
jgi:single-strand DNA-binding protein